MARAQDVSDIEELTVFKRPTAAIRVTWAEGENGKRRRRRALFTSFLYPALAMRTIAPQWRRGARCSA